MSRVFLDLICQIEMEHKPALRCYAQARGFDFSEADNTVVCRKDNREVLSATFDSLGRLAQLNSTLSSGSE